MSLTQADDMRAGIAWSKTRDGGRHRRPFTATAIPKALGQGVLMAPICSQADAEVPCVAPPLSRGAA